MSAEVTTALKRDAASQVLSSRQHQAKAKTRLGDVLKSQELSSRTLLSSDTQRISNVLESCISRVEILAILPTVLAHLDRLSSGIDEKWKGALQRHRLLEERLDTQDDLRQNSDRGQEGHVEEAGKKVRSQLESDIKNSIRDLLRLFRAHPDVGYCLRAELGVEDGVSESMQSLIGGLKKFYGQMTEQLLTSPYEEKQQDLDMQELCSCHERNKKLIAELEKKLTETINESDTQAAFEISEKECANKKLRGSLQQQKTTSDDTISQMQQDADKQCQSHIKASETKQAHLQQKINQLNVQLDKTIHENWKMERAMHEKNERVKEENEFTIKEFDDEMEKEQAELEEIETEFEMEKEELKHLEEADDVLTVEYNQVQEELRLVEEKQKELERKDKAAFIIQACWTGYRARKALQAMVKTPKKGKGKKPKKGKGKKK